MSPLLLATLAFAFVVGANDGAALLGANLSGKAVRPLPGMAALAIAIVVVPAVVGTGVADTLASGLVSFDASEGPRALLVAVTVTIGLIYVSSRLGLPTSVTQALAGAMIGAGLGAGLAVDPATAVRVMLGLALVPLAAGLAALVVALVLLRLRVRGGLSAHLRHHHAAAFLLCVVAYAANDGQKMLAVAAIAAGLQPASLGLPMMLALALLFAAGTAFGVRRLAVRFGRLLPARPLDTIIGDYAAGLAVLGSAALGTPVSMSHATTTGLVGSASVIDTYRRVRWEQVLRIGATWLTTMPAAMVIAAIVTATVH